MLYKGKGQEKRSLPSQSPLNTSNAIADFSMRRSVFPYAQDLYLRDESAFSTTLLTATWFSHQEMAGPHCHLQPAILDYDNLGRLLWQHGHTISIWMAVRLSLAFLAASLWCNSMLHSFTLHRMLLGINQLHDFLYFIGDKEIRPV